MKFYLGSHHPGWLSRVDVPLFVSDRTLREYKTLPIARGRFALDSGGFTELSTYGTWDHGPTPREYVQRVRRYAEEIGGMDWAAPQDWMCEPFITSKTGLTVGEHQRRTVGNYIDLKSIDAQLPIRPVIQGFRRRDYLHCVSLYRDAGIDLAAELLVGLGSVCRRQATSEAAQIVADIVDAVPGIKLHGFGVKKTGLALFGAALASSDSLAWSFDARRSAPLPGCVGHKSCANCLRYALRWRAGVLALRLAAPVHQLELGEVS